VWSLFYDQEGKLLLNNDAAQPEELKALHTCIRKVAQDIENLSLNTAVSAMMICVNELQKLNCHKTVILTDLVKVLAPFAPHIAEELWQQVLGQTTSVTQASAPIFNESYLVENSFELPICINGKKRTELTFDTQATKEQIIEQALATEVVQRQLEGKTPKNVIYVPGRMLNIVV
jgi:leucyl-tRNA synthetase